MENVKVSVNANQAVSEQVTLAAKKEFTVTDALGRKITIRKPNVLLQYRLMKFLGEAASNVAYMRMVTPITYLIDIDGEAIPQPNTSRELDALIQRLDEEGISALIDGVTTHFAAKETTEEQEEALKNS